MSLAGQATISRPPEYPHTPKTLPAQILRKFRTDQAKKEAIVGGKGRWSARRKMTVVLELLLGARHFHSISELVRALEEFRALYNQHWLLERLRFEPPVKARQRLALQAAA